MSGLLRTMPAALMTFCRSLPNRPKNSLRLSGNRRRSIPKSFNLSSNCMAVVLQTWQSVWPMMAISLPPLTAQASGATPW